ncbi:MAG: glycosyltransferase [Thermoplasmata archaeon]
MDTKILQIAHGQIIPEYTSGYTDRCYSIFRNANRKIISVGGLTFRDQTTKEIEGYRSLFLTLYSAIKGNRSFEILLSERIFLRRKYIKRLNELIAESEIIVYEGPWQFPFTKDRIKEKIVVYDAHNVETYLRIGNKYYNKVKDIEKELIYRADIIFVVSEEDLKNMINIHNADPQKIFLIPHQLSLKEYGWHGIDSNKIVFIGSMYQPNIDALKVIEHIAEELTQFEFHIIGNINKYPKKKKLPNIIYHGMVDEKEKDEILNASLLALNPINTGAGRNVKMVDYMLHGLPIITTEIGLRGFNLNEIRDYIYIEKIERFKNKILEVSMNREKLKTDSFKLYDYSKKLYEKETNIKAIDVIERCYDQKFKKVSK